MKKSAIVLLVLAALFLVGSFPFVVSGEYINFVGGIVIAAALAFVGVKQQSKYKAAIEAARIEKEEAEARKREYEARHGKLSCSVAGVTFDNDDGTSRQRILSGIYKEAEGGGVEASFEEYEYKGKPAIRVLVEDRCIGVIPKSDLEEVLSILKRVEFAAVYVDRFDDDGEKVYRADLTIEYAK